MSRWVTPDSVSFTFPAVVSLQAGRELLAGDTRAAVILLGFVAAFFLVRFLAIEGAARPVRVVDPRGGRHAAVELLFAVGAWVSLVVVAAITWRAVYIAYLAWVVYYDSAVRRAVAGGASA